MKFRTKTVQILVAWIMSMTLILNVGGSVPAWSTVHAQSPAVPTLQITEIDVQSYPLISVSVYGENLPTQLYALPLRLEEDRAEQPLLNSQLTEVGTQTAIVLDASRNILSIGNTGAPRLDEISRAVGRFVQLGLLSAQTDWLAAFGTGSADGDYEIISEWQQDHQGVVNSLILWRPESRPVFTSLFGVVQAGFDQFEAAPARANVRRSMVVFSDGADIVSNIETDDIVRMAQRQNVRVHTVLLGQPARDSRRNLGRLADLTGGLFVELNVVEDLDPIWGLIGSERKQQVYTYRLTQAQPQEIRVALQLEDGREIFAAREFPVVGARPSDVQIVSPTGAQPFVRQAEGTDAALADMQPSVLPIQITFNWPDGHPRDFQRVEYTIDDDTRIVDAAPFDQFNFPVANLGDGNHTIRVTAIDELGLSSSSAPLSVPFQLVGSASRSADNVVARAGQAVAGVDESQAADALSGSIGEGLRLGNIVLPSSIRFGEYAIPLNLTTVGLAFLPLLFLLFAGLLMRGRTRKQNPYFTSDPGTSLDPYADLREFDPNVVTVPSMSAFEMDEVSTEPVRMLEFDVVAHLVLHGGATHLPERFPLHEGQQIRVGRHSSYSDIILEDTRVSRQHAVIEWENEDHFIRDEGSAGGTYVNKRRLEVGDKWKLEDGDTINFNEIAYRYELVSDTISDVATNSIASM